MNKEERKEYNKKYRQDHKEEQKKYYQDYKKEMKEYAKTYYQNHKKEKQEYCQNHKEERKEKRKKYNQDHKEERKEKRKKYYQNNSTKIKETYKKWYKENSKKVLKHHNQYEKIKYKTNLNFKIAQNCKSRIRQAFKQYSTTGKLGKSKDFYGIDVDRICKKLMETLPKDYYERPSGYYHRDEIIPCSSFNFNNSEEVRKCFCPENVQWLTAKENIKKRNKINFEN